MKPITKYLNYLTIIKFIRDQWVLLMFLLIPFFACILGFILFDTAYKYSILVFVVYVLYRLWDMYCCKVKDYESRVTHKVIDLYNDNKCIYCGSYDECLQYQKDKNYVGYDIKELSEFEIKHYRPW